MLLSIPRVWDTSQQAIFNRYAVVREGENTEVGTRFLCLLRMFLSFRLLSPTTEKKRFCQTYAKEKRCNPESTEDCSVFQQLCIISQRSQEFPLDRLLHRYRRLYIWMRLVCPQPLPSGRTDRLPRIFHSRYTVFCLPCIRLLRSE